LFGSTARGDRHPDSDIDLLVAFDETRRISLLDVAGIELQLSELLGKPWTWWRKGRSSRACRNA
jgi:predicted nucleotidyltransferase